MRNNFDYELSDLLPLVTELAEKYTSKESSSVSYETAKQLMEAVEYCIKENKVDLRLFQVESKNQAEGLEQVQNHCSAREAYDRGLQIVKDKVNQVRVIYNQISEDFLCYGNQNYHDTVLEGIPGFLKFYDAKFKPQNQILTMDYPVLCSMEGFFGVDVILLYISAISIEQHFFHVFPENYITEILERYHSDYENMYFNLCDPVLVHVLCCMVIGKKIIELEWTEEEYQQLTNYVMTRKREQVKTELSELLKKMLMRFGEQGEVMFSYLRYCIEDVTIRLFQTAQNDCMERLFHQD